MRTGHIIALVGAILGIIGAAVLPWQQFVVAHVVAMGYMVPPAGQIVLGLSALMALTSLLGLITRRRKQFATATLIVSVFAIGWAVMAQVNRASAFQLMAFEKVEMLGGFTLAVIGVGLAFFGSLVVLALEAGLDPNKDYLRVAMLWNGTVIKETVLHEPRNIFLSDQGKHMFTMPLEGVHLPYKLFKADRKGNYKVGLSKAFDGEVTLGGKTATVAEHIASSSDHQGDEDYVPVVPGDWGTLYAGDKQLFFQFIRADKKLKKAFFAFDEYVAAALAISAAIQILAVIYAATLGWQETAERMLVLNEKRAMKVEVAIKEEEKKEEELVEDEEDDSSSKKAEGEEGKFGDPDEDPDKESKIPKHDGKMVDKIDPKKVGLNDLLSTNKLGGSGAIANILSSNTEGFSNKIAVAMAGTGTEFVMGNGAGGLGFQGTGSGGGGEGGYGRIHGMGRIDTGGGLGVKAGLGKKHKRRVGKIRLGGSSTRGFCKKSNISSVVRRRAGAIRACFEKRLQVKPKLGGKLTARWTITATGAVSGVSAGGSLKDAKVKNCILRVLRRMRFAKPEGGICVVQWPFVFSAG